MSQRPLDDLPGFVTALAIGLVGVGLIGLVGSIAAGVLAAPVPWLASRLVQGIGLGLGLVCVGYELRWFMNLAKQAPAPETDGRPQDFR